MADDTRFPHEAEFIGGLNCSAAKFAKRVWWVEMALRLWAVVGTGDADGGDRERWRRIMAFKTEGDATAEEDLADVAQLTKACGADVAQVRAYLSEAWQRNLASYARHGGGVGAEMSVDAVLQVWDKEMASDVKGPYADDERDERGGEEPGPHAARREQAE